MHGAEKLERLANGQVRGFRQTPVGHKHEPSGAAEPCPPTVGARPDTEILCQLFAHRRRFGLAISPLEVGQDSLERMPLAGDAALAFGVAEFDGLVAAAVQQHLLNLGRQLAPRRLDVEIVVPRQRLDELEIVRVSPVPATDRAAGERQIRMHHHALRIEELLDAQAVAGRARAGRIVERKQFGLERRHAVTADRAGVAAREHQLFAPGLIEE